jgi:Ca2+ transporting ATPase
MDSFASLALATEPPTMDLLERPPYSRDEYIVSRKMVKNLMGMAVYEIIIIYAIVFAGEHFFPEPEIKYRFGRDSPYVFPGRIQDWDGSPLYSKHVKEFGVSRHMTNVFNVFTVMQIFNLINARKIHDELNVFKGVWNNWIFFVVFLGCFGG